MVSMQNRARLGARALYHAHKGGDDKPRNNLFQLA